MKYSKEIAVEPVKRILIFRVLKSMMVEFYL